jgi:TM2 domain-containing membrane protein YozV
VAVRHCGCAEFTVDTGRRVGMLLRHRSSEAPRRNTTARRQSNQENVMSNGETIPPAPAPAPAPPQGGKSFVATLILAILLPGIDRLYAGYIGLGILKFLTGGGCMIWWLVDIILLATGKYKDKDGNDLVK